MREFLTIAEIYRMQHQLIEMFGGIHGVRDQAAVEAAVFRPPNRLLPIHRGRSRRTDGILCPQPRIPGRQYETHRLYCSDVFLRRNGFYIDVGAEEGHAFIEGSIARGTFRFPRIVDWIRSALETRI